MAAPLGIEPSKKTFGGSSLPRSGAIKPSPITLGIIILMV